MIKRSSDLAATVCRLRLAYSAACEPASLIGKGRKCILDSFFPAINLLIIKVLARSSLVSNLKPLAEKWRGQASIQQPIAIKSIGSWSRPSAIGQMGAKMTPISNRPQRMLRVLYSMCSSREGWPKTTPAPLRLLKCPERHPHEDELKGRYFAPIMPMPVGYLRLPGNRKATVSHLPEVTEWYGSGMPTVLRHS